MCWCYFPEVPGAPVKHPCLVLSALKDQNNAHKLIIALGTSAVKNNAARTVYPGEIVFPPGDPDLHVKPIDGVPFNVKFSLREEHVLIVDYDRDCFYVPAGQAWPKIGSVNLRSGTKAHARMAQAIAETNLAATIKALKESVLPPKVVSDEAPDNDSSTAAPGA